jgi:hypothetical protein
MILERNLFIMILISQVNNKTYFFLGFSNTSKTSYVVNKEKKQGGGLSSLYEKPAEPTQKQEKITLSSSPQNPKYAPSSENKLTLLFDNKLPAAVKKEDKKGGWNQKGFNRNKIDYDDEFPEL